jgi:tRNA dimethylallyltransferase
MFHAGFVEEVERLLASGVRADSPAMSSIGYAEVAAVIEGRMALDEAVDATKRATRRLARRQAQWFREDDRRASWVTDAQDIEMQANIFTGACTNTIRGERR